MSIERFPTPEFETQYTIPTPEYPNAKSDSLQYFDVFVLVIVLALASYLAIKKRSRYGLYFIAIFSVFYFGFYRDGCVCSIGSIQNLTLSFFNTNYIIPVNILLFFILPLLFALFFGRTFCSGVCPLGAIQEMFIYRPIQLPLLLRHTLSMIPFIYLGFSVLFAAINSSFFICKYDPFIGFYRLSAPYWILGLGGLFLLTGMFIARPYCRFFCPYSVVIGSFSLFSKKHLKITPDKCIKCKLCENSCPIEAIDKPAPEIYTTKKYEQLKKMGIYIILIPLFMFIVGFGFSKLSNLLSKDHRTVRLAEQIYKEEKGTAKNTTLDSDAFREKGQSIEELYKDASKIQKKFKTGTWILGMFLGFVFSLKVIIVMLRRKRTDYEPNKFNCVSCGRCMEYCPVKKPDNIKKILIV